MWHCRLGWLAQVLKEGGDDEGGVWYQGTVGEGRSWCPTGRGQQGERRASSAFLIFSTLFPAFPERVKHLLGLFKVHEAQVINCGL